MTDSQSGPRPGAKTDAARWPVEIRLKQAEKVLEIDFDDSKSFSFAAEFLRVHSPSAEVVGHGPGQRTIVAGRRHVGIMELIPVGNYAVQIKFDDLHDTGIFSWDYFYHLGETQDELWLQYLDDLEAEGLSRDP
jgi:DUF971 family protein